MVLLAVAITGCANQDMRDLKQYVKEVKARKQGRIAPLPEIKQIETFVYHPDDRRSPFAPADRGEEETEQSSTTGISPEPDRRKEELENYALDSMRMVGTLEQADTMWALIRTKDKTIYRVKAGNYMGKNHGQITQITESKAELTEIVPDGRGGYRERQASLALKE
jgi:type IV pilus assembly protein PilP